MKLQSKRILLYAPNVHTGGGLVLLQSLLKEWPKSLGLVGWFDARAKAQLCLPNGAQITWVCPSIGSRLLAEISLVRAAFSDDQILCFHGLPPLLRNKGRVHIFQQNRNYLGLVPLKTFSWRTRQRLRFEQTVAYLFRYRCACYWVQTPSMAREIQNWYGNEPVNVRVLPFAQRTKQVHRLDPAKWDFIYVADGEAHKNHKCLVEAWVFLAQQGIRPTLALTLSGRDTTLMSWVQQQTDAHGLLICNLGYLTHENLLQLYGQTGALVFPSISESFGLPLIEASNLGLPIVASELDFVRDVCEPTHTFDPRSPISIARAIRRFLGRAELPVQPLSAVEFLGAVLCAKE